MRGVVVHGSDGGGGARDEQIRAPRRSRAGLPEFVQEARLGQRRGCLRAAEGRGGRAGLTGAEGGAELAGGGGAASGGRWPSTHGRRAV